MKPFSTLLSFLFLTSLLTAGPASATPRGHPSLSVYFDNDLFAGSDEQYTNGGRVAWLSRNYRRDMLPAQVLKAADIVHFPTHDGWRFNYGFSLTQLIFTPEDLRSRALIVDDRPYSAYLGLGFSLHAKRKNVAHSLELALGVVGPWALGEEAQNGTHKLRNFDTAKGWAHQIKNEPTVNAFWTTKWRFPIDTLSSGSFQTDVLPRTGIALGNLETSANTGFTFRIGFNPPNDFANQRLSPTAYNQQF